MITDDFEISEHKPDLLEIFNTAVLNWTMAMKEGPQTIYDEPGGPMLTVELQENEEPGEFIYKAILTDENGNPKEEKTYRLHLEEL